VADLTLTFVLLMYDNHVCVVDIGMVAKVRFGRAVGVAVKMRRHRRITFVLSIDFFSFVGVQCLTRA